METDGNNILEALCKITEMSLLRVPIVKNGIIKRYTSLTQYWRKKNFRGVIQSGAKIIIVKKEFKKI